MLDLHKKRSSHKNNEEIMEKLSDWDFKNETDFDEDDWRGNLYNNYKEYFTKFKHDFDNVKSISGQLEGVVEEIVDATRSVKLSSEFIAQGAQSQTEDVGRCMDVADNLAEKINSMDTKSKELIDLAFHMSNENTSGKQAVQNLSENQEKTNR